MATEAIISLIANIFADVAPALIVLYALESLIDTRTTLILGEIDRVRGLAKNNEERIQGICQDRGENSLPEWFERREAT